MKVKSAKELRILSLADLDRCQQFFRSPNVWIRFYHLPPEVECLQKVCNIQHFFPFEGGPAGPGVLYWGQNWGQESSEASRLPGGEWGGSPSQTSARLLQRVSFASQFTVLAVPLFRKTKINNVFVLSTSNKFYVRYLNTNQSKEAQCLLELATHPVASLPACTPLQEENYLLLSPLHLVGGWQEHILLARDRLLGTEDRRGRGGRVWQE